VPIFALMICLRHNHVIQDHVIPCTCMLSATYVHLGGQWQSSLFSANMRCCEYLQSSAVTAQRHTALTYLLSTYMYSLVTAYWLTLKMQSDHSDKCLDFRRNPSCSTSDSAYSYTFLRSVVCRLLSVRNPGEQGRFGGVKKA